LLNFSKAITLSDANAVAGSWAAGSAVAATTFTAGVSSTAPTFSFATKATVPTAIKLRATDTDGVSSATNTEGTSTIRSGRVRIQNAYGSELLALPVPVVLEYYDTATSTGWRAGADTCTTLTSANFAYGFPTATGNNLVACETAGTLSGTKPTYSLSLSAPGTGNGGWTNVALNLGGTAIGTVSTVPYVKCTATGASGGAETPASLPWLQFNWLGAGSTNPTARATFGAYKSPLIYRRENY
jgi:MSHA biogenesis protein MshQ